MIKNIPFNPYLLYVSVNLFILILYLLKLSSLYQIRFIFVSYYISVLLSFFIFSFPFWNRRSFDSKKLEKAINISNVKLYKFIMFVFYLIGVVASIYQIKNYGTPLELENKVNRPIGDHYVQYLVNLLTISGSMAYILLRSNKRGKFISFFVFISSIGLLSVWLNRGAFTPILLVVIYYEYTLAYLKGNFKKFLVLCIIVTLTFIIFFGYIGNVRTEYVFENVFRYSINYHYGMNENIPSSIVQLYIYLTSPLENMSRIFYNQDVYEYKFGQLMIYPFIAPIVKYFDIGVKYPFIPPLDSIAGLNVSTFLADSFTDFGFLGAYIYMLYLIFLMRVAERRFGSNIFGFLLYTSIINISLWMAFDNAFAIGPFMINYVVFYILSRIFGKVVFK